ncbi:hypothetical protein F5B19DRAFT_478507 [Rostrohypoxylon terebratum]|nr:hypothetical protein F5B19DRAFT_478507 [Rostrohypoxylon terebratum]
MLDDGIKHMIEGVDIDRPHNAITLTHSLHHLFGDFMIFFEPVPDSKHPNTYRIDTILPALMSRKLDIPITRTLYLTSNRIIDPPSLRLLAVHRAIAHILHLSAAGGYIDRLLEDAEEKGVEADGSTDLGCLVQLGLRGLSITKS